MDEKAIDGQAEVKIRRARRKLLTTDDRMAVFFSMLLTRLKFSPCRNISTAAVDGRNLFYSPEYINGLKGEEIIGLLVHEVMHCVLGHFDRLVDAPRGLANIAMDLAINQVITPAFTLPPNGISLANVGVPGLEALKSAEYYYERLAQQAEKVAIVWGDSDDPGASGGVLIAEGQGQKSLWDSDDNSVELQKILKAEWASVAKTAVVESEKYESKARGVSSFDSLKEIVLSQTSRSEISWESVLDSKLQAACATAVNRVWFPPNRRLAHTGMYFPSWDKEKRTSILVVIDVSGSVCYGEARRKFVSETIAILEKLQGTAYIMYCDNVVHRVDEWRTGEPLPEIVAMDGGGTDHRPIWRWLRDDPRGEEIELVICLTDGYTDFGSSPDQEVIWGMVTSVTPPFGEVLYVK